jgi:F0F1-type ATP synthase assembly protein I
MQGNDDRVQAMRAAEFIGGFIVVVILGYFIAAWWSRKHPL